MKKILITGAHSYVGSSFKKWLSEYQEKYIVDTISLRDNKWKEISFSEYDVVLHTVGIAHVNAKPEMESLYYDINRDLTIQTAIKSKNDGVKQFLFISSIIVFGESGKAKKDVHIMEKNKPQPSSFYGNSKLEAEKGILELQDSNFDVVILRPPMIYGENSKGNFPKLVKLSEKMSVFPDIRNERSMIYIENLCEFMRLMIENEENGIFHPQNEEYVNTTNLMRMLREMNDQKFYSTTVFNSIISLLSNRVNSLNKIFGSFKYDKKMSIYKQNYWVYDFESSIKRVIDQKK